MEAPINYGCATVCNAETKTEAFLITLQYQAENRKYEDLELTLKSAENVLVTFDATHNLMCPSNEKKRTSLCQTVPAEVPAVSKCVFAARDVQSAWEAL